LYTTAHSVLNATPDFAFSVGREGTLQDFRGIYRLLRFVLEPQSVMKRAPAVFGRYRRPGRLVIEAAERGFARAHFEDCVGYDTFLWHEIAGGSVAVLEVCGASDLQWTIREVAPGEAVLDARWRT
jgi:hypothetical protein